MFSFRCLATMTGVPGCSGTCLIIKRSFWGAGARWNVWLREPPAGPARKVQGAHVRGGLQAAQRVPHRLGALVDHAHPEYPRHSATRGQNALIILAGEGMSHPLGGEIEMKQRTDEEREAFLGRGGELVGYRIFGCILGAHGGRGAGRGAWMQSLSPFEQSQVHLSVRLH